MNNNLYFGGIPDLLVDDFNQKQPIGQLATTSLLKQVKNKYEMKIQLDINDNFSDRLNNNSYMKVSQCQKKKEKEKNLNQIQYFQIIKKINLINNLYKD